MGKTLILISVVTSLMVGCAQNRSKAPTGVLPRANQETVFTPDGKAYYRTRTEIPTKETTQNTATKELMSLDEAKKKCIELGFKDKTELLGSCVLKLSK